MPDVVVTKEVLEDAARDLKDINDEFKNMSAMWEGGDIWGHDTVKKAMDSFIDNWWVKREKLQVQLDDLTKKMDQAKEAWNETEDALASSFDEQPK
jgi:flagellar biosynthesis chaperone FliJ